MNLRPIQEARDPDLRGIAPALERAALRARELARQTGTAVVISRNGVIEHLWPGQADDTIGPAAPSPALPKPATGGI